jgi:hypothetical protein
VAQGRAGPRRDSPLLNVEVAGKEGQYMRAECSAVLLTERPGEQVSAHGIAEAAPALLTFSMHTCALAPKTRFGPG